MRIRTIISIITTLVFFSFQSKGQGRIQDSSLFVTNFAPSYAFQMPGADLDKRFGVNSNIGMRVGFKTNSGFQLDLNGSFIFGNNVEEEGLLNSLRTERGNILTKSGENAIIQYFERGFTVTLQAGMVFPLIGPNPNSGFLVKAGPGFMQHNIRIQVEGNNVPQLKGDKKQYFDRRASGFCLHEFVGYQYYGNNEVINFFIGVELFQGFTKGRRSYNVDERAPGTDDRTDLLYGIRAGYILPIYDSKPEEFYYN